MKTTLKSWIVFGIFFLIAVSQTNAEDNIAMKKIARDNTAFATDLYNRLKTNDGNLFFSPFSISTALAMTYAGAREDTAAQMADVLHFSTAPGQLHASMEDLISQLNALQKETDIELRVANAIWAQKGYQFLDAFFRIVRQSYQAEVKQVDFASEAEAARRAINAWVEEQTNQKIRDLIPPGVLNALSRLVLVNAIYFKGFWDSRFKPADTRDMQFWLTAETPEMVSMMHQKQLYGYWENEWLQILEMPYKDKSLSLIVLLPKEKAGISQLEQKLTLENISAWQSQLSRQKVSVFFPRFKIESQFNLGQTLSAMGMADAFDPQRADFSGMLGKKELHISAVIHKAYVNINEEGTEAAAATGVAISTTAIAPPPPTFKADHPFVFFIRDNASQSVLFFGRVLDPS